MRKVAVIVIAALLACATADANLDRLFYRSCNGVLEFMPNGPVGGAFYPGFIDDVLDGSIALLRKRAECKCAGQFTDDEFDLMFDPVTAMLNNMQDSPVTLPDTHCLKVHFKRNLQDLFVGRMVLPNTCSYTTWKDQGKCLVQLPIPTFSAEIKVALGRCKTLNNKASVIPFFSVNCVGSGCTAAMTPCGAGDSCAAGSTCFVPFDMFNVSLSNLPHEVFDQLKESSLYSDAETSPGCYQSPFVANIDDRTPSNDIFTALLTMYHRMVTGSNAILRNPKFCVPDSVYEMLYNATQDEPVTIPPQFSDDAVSLTPYTLPRSSCVLNSTEAQQVELTYVTGWDGQLTSGSALGQAPAITPPTPAPTGAGAAYPLVRATCDGSLVFGRELFWLKANTNLMQLLNEAVSLFKAMQACRTNPAMDKMTLIRHWQSNNPAFWLQFLDEAFTEPLVSNMNLFNNTLYYRVEDFMDGFSVANLPETCNMETWLSTGKCTAMFTGLKRLLQLDVNGLLYVEECPSSDLFSYSLYCQGTDCEPLLGGVLPCNPSTANACPSTFECRDVFDALDTLQEALADEEDEPGDDPVYEMLKTHDWLEIVTGPNTVEDLCSWSNDSSNWNLTGITSEVKCSGPARFRNDIASLLVRIHGAPSAPANPTTGTHFCMPTFDFVGDEEHLEDWVNSLFAMSGSEFVLNDVVSAVFDPTTGAGSPADAVPTATQTPTPSGAGAAAPAIFAGIAAALVAVVGQQAM